MTRRIGFLEIKNSKTSKRVEASYRPATSRRESPLDRLIRWTEFRDKLAFSKRERSSSFRQLAERILHTKATSKEGLPWLKLAEFGGRPKPGRKSLRNNANMRAINGIELDYDDGDLSWDQAWARLYEARLPAMLYTTRSYTEEQPRFRVLLPTSRRLPRERRAGLVSRAYGVLKGTIDGASFTDSQAFYYGSVGAARVRVDLIDMRGGRYIDLAHDLDDHALNKHGEPAGEAVEPDEVDNEVLSREPDIERVKRALANIPPSAMEQYGDWLMVGQALHHEFGGLTEGLALWDEASQRCISYDAEELADTWDSFGSYAARPITIGTLYRLAKQHTPLTSGNLTFHTPSECTAAPPRGYLWKGMIAPGDVASIFGAPGAGKSLIAPHIGYMIARGDLAFGMRTKQGLVFYVAAEDASGLRQRVAALKRRHDDAPDFQVVGGVSDLFAEDSPDLKALAETVATQRPALIVIDTLAMAFPALEENDARSMGRVVAVARRLAEHDSAVLLIHHDTKAEGSTPRGHSILNGALDMAMHVKRDESGVVRGRLTKNRNGSPHRNIAFRIGIEEFDIDEDGDPITAAVAEELADTGSVVRVRLTGPESAALAKLMDMEAEGRVSEDDWRAACIGDRKVSGAEDMNSRKRAMRRAVQGLAKKGQIETRNGFVTANNKADSGYED